MSTPSASRSFRRWIPGAVALTLALCAPNLHAERPRVGLVLGGGGSALALAHVGVLQVLEELRIPVDCIAGTSFGAFYGGLYASGMPLPQIRQAAARIDWTRSSGGDISLVARSLVRPVDDVGEFDRLPIPFRAVVTDLENGQMVVFRSGRLSTAMRASITVAGLIAPYPVAGKALADGALVASLPVAVARQMCGDSVLVVVNLGRPRLARADLTTEFGINQQIANMMAEANSFRALAELRVRDVLIVPQLDDFSSFMARSDRAIEMGEKAARDKADSLRTLAMSPAEYEAHVRARRRQR